MTQEHWQQLKDILDAAWAMSSDERKTFLNRVCAQDETLRSNIEALLDSDKRIGEFLVTPAIELARFDAGGAALLAAKLPEDYLIPGVIASAVARLSGDAQEDSDLIGTFIDSYLIAALIGKGGMGAVYRAERKDDFRMQVAIKLLKRGTDTEAALSRFRNERQILAGLQAS